MEYYSQSGKTDEQLETSDDVMTELQEMGVADVLTANVARHYKFNHPGERILTDGMRFGFQTVRLEGGTPIQFNRLYVWGEDEDSKKRVRWLKQFQDPDELDEVLGLTQGTPRAREIHTRINSLINRQPILVQGAAKTNA